MSFRLRTLLGPRPVLLAAGLAVAGALGAWLPFGRGELPLRITKFLLPGTRRGESPSVGEPLRVRLSINRPAFIYVFGVDRETGAVLRLFPEDPARAALIGPGRVVLPGADGELTRGLTDHPGPRALVAGAGPARLEDATLRSIEEEMRRAAREEDRRDRSWKAARAVLERRFPEAVGFAFDVLP